MNNYYHFIVITGYGHLRDNFRLCIQYVLQKVTSIVMHDLADKKE